MAVDGFGVPDGRPRADERLVVEANLSVELDGRQFAISADGERIAVHAPSVSAGLAAASSAGQGIPALAAALADAGVTVELRTGDAVFAVLGEDAAPDRLTATLFSDAVDVRASGIVAGALRFR